ncbi:MAG: IS1 family transposase [Cyanobacteriota bacterium]
MTEVQVRPKPKRRLTVQMDELWSFVNHLGDKQWVWLALDAETREIVGVHIGDRSATSAQALWQSMPPIYRQCAVFGA